MKNIRSAFTMAEILLALTIIGVISVLVLPSVTNGTSGKQFLVTYKKEIAVLNQGVDTNYAMSGWDFAGTRENYSTAVGEILRNRLGATEDDRTWTITGTAGSGFTAACAKKGYAAEGEVCFKNNETPLLEVNKAATQDTKKASRVYTLKDGLASVILLGEDFGTVDQIPCRAAGQRTVQPGKDADGNSTTGYSSAANYCLAYLDVNGATGPNQVVTCANGVKNGGKISADMGIDGCTVSGGMINDVYPIIIYGDTVAPASPAALAILQERFSN